jgi:thioredoxin reductase
MDADVIVVGGSFAGLAAAMQLARARRRVIVIDAGLPRNRFAKASHGFLGQDGRAPAAIMHDAAAQLLAYPGASIIQGEALSAAGSAGEFELGLADGTRLSCKRLILATGVVDEFPAIEGVKERWGATVLHCPYCHGYEVADRRLGIIGSHPMSVHGAQLIADWSDDVTYFANGYSPDAAQSAALAARGVRVVEGAVTALLGEAPAIERIVLANGTSFALDAAFLATRVTIASPLAQQLGCQIDEGIIGELVKVDQFQETTVSGVYAAGDMARMPHNATWAASDGVSAGVFAHRSLVFGAMPA